MAREMQMLKAGMQVLRCRQVRREGELGRGTGKGRRMQRQHERKIARQLLDRFGRTYAEEAGIKLRNEPAPLFQLLFASLLMAARIPAASAARAARALRQAHLTTPEKMASATWQERVAVISNNGYRRFDESVAALLGRTAERLLNRYGGDLRLLRDEAEEQCSEERGLLQQFSGIGEVGADIFLREVQAVWPEAYPYVDRRVRSGARRLGLSEDPKHLSKLVSREHFVPLADALVRFDLTRGRAQELLESTH
jgi:endonuclease III